MRERFVVDELTFSDGRVIGIRGRASGGKEIVEEATLVVGADGRHSLLARFLGVLACTVSPTDYFSPATSAA